MLLKRFTDDKTATGPAKSTRAQQRNISAEQAKENRKPGDWVAGRINAVSMEISSSFRVSFMDGNEIHSAIGLADDGADESIVSARTVERAVLNGIGKMSEISPVSLQIALK